MTIRTMTIAAALMLAAQMEMPMANAQTQTPTQGRVQAQPGTQAPSALPNGASSLNETYQDWTVICAANEKGRICVLSQQQRKSDSKQLVLAAEFNAVTANEVRGTLVLPFGLRLADGVVLQVDDQPAQSAVPFATCLPAGCIVPVSFGADMVKAIRTGATLKVTAKAHDSGQIVQFGVSLKGFSGAQDRVADLSK